VVTDFQNNNPNVYKRLGYDAKHGYFNAGMLLVNLDYWRNNDVVPLFLDYISNNSDKLDFADQDVLNPLFYDKKKVLPIRFNLNTALLLKKEYLLISSEYYKEIEDAFKHPAIIHYTTHRPWFKESPNPMLHYWEKYRDLTIWKGQTMKPKKKTLKDYFSKMIAIIKRLTTTRSTKILKDYFLQMIVIMKRLVFARSKTLYDKEFTDRNY
jgi:lipopolysaccharide biosynthesis glycosyltransferase